MFVICKSCQSKIPVSHRPSGGLSASGVKIEGDVRMKDGGLAFGSGGKVSFGPGGSIRFSGGPPKSSFTCICCGSTHDYDAQDIKDDE